MSALMAMAWLGYGVAALSAMLAVVAVLLRPRSLARLSFAVALLIVSLEAFFATLASGPLAEGRPTAWLGPRFAMTLLIPPAWMLFSFCYGRGDQWQVLRRRAWFLGGVLVIALVLMAVVLHRLVGGVAWATEPPSWTLLFAPAATVMHVYLLTGFVVILLALEQTLRAAVGVMRWRMKFMAVGVGVIFVPRIHTACQAILYRQWNVSLDLINTLALGAGCVLMVAAMTRAGLSAVEVYPSRRIILGSVSLTLVGLYLVGLGVLSRLTTMVDWPGAVVVQAALALLATVALGLVLLSDRIRHHVATFVSRNLRRPTHDYRAVWQRFAQRTDSLADESEACRVTTEIISEVFQANSVTLWILDEKAGATFGASSHLSRQQAEARWRESSPGSDLVSGLQGCRRPFLLQTVRETWAACLKRFTSLEHRVNPADTLCVPLWSVNRVVGIMLVGNRVSRSPFTTEDLDLLGTISLEIGRGLTSIRQAASFAEAKEVEALRNMSAFMAHDLKNTASTLSLTLQNLRKHYHRPEFREDALKAVNQSVVHLNELISGLSALREGLHVQLVPGDLNDLVARTLEELESGLGVPIQKNLNPLPAVSMDSARLKTVVVNLLLNARDAIQTEGTIEVATQRLDSGAELCIRDDGCGMTEAFVRQSLFRPFSSTKKRGLGIGMFQSRLIVESHRGSIEVESAPDRGTTFRILLPLASQTA